MNRFERLLVMVPWLLKHPGISHEEAADHFAITKDQLVQDLMLLTVTGVGQYANEQFDLDYSDGRIYVVDQLGLDKPFTFDSTEAACLLLGLDSLANLPTEVSGFTQSDILAVRDRISQSVPINSGVNAVIADEGTDQVLAEIARAISEGLKITFNYWNDSRDDVTQREVSPLRISTGNQHSRFDGYEAGKGWRTFRVEHIDTLLVTTEPVDFANESFEPMKTFEVDIEVPTKMHHLLETFSVVKRRKLDEFLIAVRVRIAEPRWLARQVLASGCAIKVVAPAEVASQVESIVQEARSAYPRKSNSK